MLSSRGTTMVQRFHGKGHNMVLYFCIALHVCCVFAQLSLLWLSLIMLRIFIFFHYQGFSAVGFLLLPCVLEDKWEVWERWFNSASSGKECPSHKVITRFCSYNKSFYLQARHVSVRQGDIDLRHPLMAVLCCTFRYICNWSKCQWFWSK